MTDPDESDSRPRFVPRWVTANVAGWILGAIVFHASAAVLPGGIPLVPLISYLLYGAIFGLAQWSVLRGVVSLRRWIVACTIGFPVGLVVSETVAMGGLPLAVLGGPFAWFLLSILQWRVLRRAVASSGWWVLVNSLALGGASIVGFFAGHVLGSLVFKSGLPGATPSGDSVTIEGGTQAGWALSLAQSAGTALGMALAALCTGILLERLLRRRLQTAAIPDRAEVPV
jgi:hypothetical protein